MKPDIYFITTYNCNYACEHCSIEAGPGKKDTTISQNDFEKVIEHLPKTSMNLGLTGGEIFTIKDSLYGFLDYIQFENQRRKKRGQGKLEVDLQSNGFWAKNKERRERILSELENYGIGFMDIASDDKWHRREGGLKHAELKKIKKTIKEKNYSIKSVCRGAPNNKNHLAPVGRAKNLNINPLRMDFNWGGEQGIYCRNSLSKYKSLTLNPKGEVFMCCVQKFPLRGNVIEEPLTQIVKRVRKNPRFNAINKEGIIGLATLDGWDEEFAEELIIKHGECGFCFRFYSDE